MDHQMYPTPARRLMDYWSFLFQVLTAHSHYELVGDHAQFGFDMALAPFADPNFGQQNLLAIRIQGIFPYTSLNEGTEHSLTIFEQELFGAKPWADAHQLYVPKVTHGSPYQITTSHGQILMSIIQGPQEFFPLDPFHTCQLLQGLGGGYHHWYVQIEARA